MYRENIQSIPMVVILWIVTCGIYGLIWIYQTGRVVKDYTGDSTINPGVDLLLCIVTCGIYQLFWFYKLGERIRTCGDIASVPINENGLVYLLLNLFGMSIVAAAIAQSDLNKVWTSA